MPKMRFARATPCLDDAGANAGGLSRSVGSRGSDLRRSRICPDSGCRLPRAERHLQLYREVRPGPGTTGISGENAAHARGERYIRDGLNNVLRPLCQRTANIEDVYRGDDRAAFVVGVLSLRSGGIAAVGAIGVLFDV